MISLFLVVLAAACYDEEKDNEESSDDGSPEIIFTTTCTSILNLGTKAPGRLKIGKNIEFKLLLKGRITSANLSNIFFCSFIRLNISLNVDILCSIYCGEKSRHFTPLALSA